MRYGDEPVISPDHPVRMQWIGEGRGQTYILSRMSSIQNDDLELYAENNAGVILEEFAMENRIPEGDADAAGDYNKNDDNEREVRSRLTGC